MSEVNLCPTKQATSQRDGQKGGHEEEGGLRALPTETKVESGTSESKSGTSVNLSNSGCQPLTHPGGSRSVSVYLQGYLAHKKTPPPPGATIGP